MKRVSMYTIAWTFWVLFFLVVEGLAFFRGPKGATFSEHWWSLFRLRDHAPTWLRAVLLGVQVTAGVWLTGHLAFGLWSLPWR